MRKIKNCAQFFVFSSKVHPWTIFLFCYSFRSSAINFHYISCIFCVMINIDTFLQGEWIVLNSLKISYKTLISIFGFNLNEKAKKIMSIGIKISFVLTLFGTLLMSLYITTNPAYILFDLGTNLFKSGTCFISMFIVCGYSFSKICKDLKR